MVEHGKRANSIVKNMLLHSRQESGEHRPVGVNALVAESLNLAYHGARAAKQGFNITLEQSFDPAAGKVDVFPQEIIRVLLNLISNGFYAATKLSDINMPGMSGLDLLPKAKAMRPDVPVIMVAAYDDAETKRKALASGADAFLTKPIDFTIVRNEIDMRIRRAA